jgi:uncharacterized phage protein (TIGR02220 family)
VNYYPHHIGDYLRDTAHLSPMEDGLYRRMLDVIYASEKPLPNDQDMVCRLVRARTEDERASVAILLQEFFEKRADGWHNKRAEEEIRKAKKRIKAAKDNGKMGGRPQTQRVSKKNPMGSQEPQSPETQSKALQKPKAKSQTEDKSTVGLKPNGFHEEALSVLEYLNQVASRDYRPVDANLSLIAARLREGATVDDCKAVISRKCADWAGSDMAQYLRPATLFNATKFAQYQGEKSTSRITVDM